MSPPDDLRPFDRSRFRTKPLVGRAHLVETARFAQAVEPSASAADFLASLPDFLGARALRGLAAAIVAAAAARGAGAVGVGGQVVKVGLGRLVVDRREGG